MTGELILLGTAGADTLRPPSGYSGIVKAWGLDGDDLIEGGSGNDQLVGGTGRNTLRGGAGDDMLFAGDGDILDGGSGRNTVVGGAGDDNIYFRDKGPLPRDFDELAYLGKNLDVKAAVDLGIFTSGLDHFERWGQVERRAPNHYYDETYYLSQNPDVLLAVARGIFKSGFDHYLHHGADEGRLPYAQAANDGNVIFTGAGKDAVHGNFGQDSITVNGPGEKFIDGQGGSDKIWLLPGATDLVTVKVRGGEMISAHPGTKLHLVADHDARATVFYDTDAPPVFTFESDVRVQLVGVLELPLAA